MKKPPPTKTDFSDDYLIIKKQPSQMKPGKSKPDKYQADFKNTFLIMPRLHTVRSRRAAGFR